MPVQLRAGRGAHLRHAPALRPGRPHDPRGQLHHRSRGDVRQAPRPGSRGPRRRRGVRHPRARHLPQRRGAPCAVVPAHRDRDMVSGRRRQLRCHAGQRGPRGHCPRARRRARRAPRASARRIVTPTCPKESPAPNPSTGGPAQRRPCGHHRGKPGADAPHPDAGAGNTPSWCYSPAGRRSPPPCDPAYRGDDLLIADIGAARRRARPSRHTGSDRPVVHRLRRHPHRFASAPIARPSPTYRRHKVAASGLAADPATASHSATPAIRQPARGRLRDTSLPSPPGRRRTPSTARRAVAVPVHRSPRIRARCYVGAARSAAFWGIPPVGLQCRSWCRRVPVWGWSRQRRTTLGGRMRGPSRRPACTTLRHRQPPTVWLHFVT